MPGAEETLSLSLSPQPTNPTKSLASARAATCRRRALGEPHDSRLLSARSLAISARARRGSVLRRYSIRLYMGWDSLTLGRTDSTGCPRWQTLRLPMPKSPPTSAIRGSTHSYVSVCVQTTIISPLAPKRGLMSHACRNDKDLPLISSGIVAGPSRLNKPIVWPRKAGSTSPAPCSPLTLWHFSSLVLCVARSPPAYTLRRPN